MIDDGLSPGAEGGAFHVDVRPSIMMSHIVGLGRLNQELPEARTDGVCEGNMGDDAFTKETVLAVLFGFVDKLINENNVARAYVFLKRTDRTDADDPLHAEQFHGPNVGSMIEFAGKEAMATRMPREKNNFTTCQGTGE